MYPKVNLFVNSINFLSYLQLNRRIYHLPHQNQNPLRLLIILLGHHQSKQLHFLLSPIQYLYRLHLLEITLLHLYLQFFLFPILLILYRQGIVRFSLQIFVNHHHHPGLLQNVHLNLYCHFHQLNLSSFSRNQTIFVIPPMQSKIHFQGYQPFL